MNQLWVKSIDFYLETEEFTLYAYHYVVGIWWKIGLPNNILLHPVHSEHPV